MDSLRAPHGVLVIDKPRGPTSHDVVARLRKILKTRAVGHAGTLDPAATGVLVVGIGEGTKLTPYLSAQEKQYDATVSFGRATDSLDAEGQVTEEGPLSEEFAHALASWRADGPREPILEAALDHERARAEQIPPAFSAIKLAGRPAYQSARRGEALELAPRPVRVHALDLVATRPESFDLRLTVSKGYYVRSLARDLGISLGVPAHLSSLRRTASGTFTLSEAIALDASPERLAEALQSIASSATRVLPAAHLTSAGVRRATHGQPLTPADFESAPSEGVAAWMAPDGTLVAIGRHGPDKIAVERGFAQSTSSSAS